MDPFIIAEIGSNWRISDDARKNLASAKKQIGVARELGASAVKFQLFTHKELYGIDGDDTFALPREWIPKLALECSNVGIEFMCSAFSIEGLKLVDEYVTRHKVASSKFSNTDFLLEISGYGKDVLYSLGMTSIDHVDGRICWENDVPILCASKYPAEIWDYDLQKFGADNWIDGQWGLSDHTVTTELAKLCRANGGTYFEKHVKLDQIRIETPDSHHSIGVSGFRHYIESIKSIDHDHARKVTSEAKNKYADKYDEHLNIWSRPLRPPEPLSKSKELPGRRFRPNR